MADIKKKKTAEETKTAASVRKTSEEKNPQRSKKKHEQLSVQQKRKHILIIVVIAVAVALLVMWLFNLAIKKHEEELAAATAVTVYGDLDFENSDNSKNKYSSVDYYEPDYSVDIFSEKEYLDLIKGQGIMYVEDNYSFNLNDIDDKELEPGQRFFKKYFYAVNHGDYKTYNGMIASDYVGNPAIYGENPAVKKFPMQRLYNISIKELFVSERKENVYDGKHAVFGIYEVSYSIHKNDGEFRSGLVSDAVLPVIYQTATTDAGTDKEKTVITKVYYYDDIVKDSEESEAK